jgi:hypothetical protein
MIKRTTYFRTPSEKIIRTDIFALMHNTALFLESSKGVVLLECGHKVITRNVNRAHCPRCQKMFDDGYDWDGFRNLRNGARDLHRR